MPGHPVIPLRQVLPQPDHQGSGQPLLAVGGGEPQQHGLPGQSEQRRDRVLVGLPGSERVVEDHPVLDSGELPELLQDVSQVPLPTIQDQINTGAQ